LWIIASPTLPLLTELFLPPEGSQILLGLTTGKLTLGLIEMHPAVQLDRHMYDKGCEPTVFGNHFRMLTSWPCRKRSGHRITLVSSMAVECERTIYLLVLQSSSQRRRR
jgi:hypothetical protein